MKKYIPMILALGVGYFVGTRYPMLLKSVN